MLGVGGGGVAVFNEARASQLIGSQWNAVSQPASVARCITASVYATLYHRQSLRAAPWSVQSDCRLEQWYQITSSMTANFPRI